MTSLLGVGPLDGGMVLSRAEADGFSAPWRPFPELAFVACFLGASNLRGHLSLHSFATVYIKHLLS